MKKIFCILACLFTLFLTAQADQKIIVQRGTEMKAYNKISDALSNVAEGDTIYLGTGQYDGFTLKTLSYVRGNGPGTYINGNVNINIPGTPTPTETLVQGLNINGNLEVSSQINDLQIKHCSFKQTNFQANLPNCVIDRCYITEQFNINTFVNQMTVKHTKIYNIAGGSASNNGCNFINCNIYAPKNTKSTSMSGTFFNCIIDFDWQYVYASNFYYCLYYKYGNKFYLDEVSSFDDSCWSLTNSSSRPLSSSCDMLLDVSQYKGSNGEQIGIYDATCPFTLTPRVPKATSNSITVNNNKLTVNITVTKE